MKGQRGVQQDGLAKVGVGQTAAFGERATI